MPSTVDTMASRRDPDPVVELRRVAVIRGERAIVDDVSLEVAPGDRWVILGPNGCGKTTLMRTIALHTHPSRGDVVIEGLALGTFDTRRVRPRIAYASASLATDLRPALSAAEAVMAAINGALETWWHDYSEQDAERARTALRTMGVGGLASRALGSLSSGEQQRVLLARALVVNPLIVLLDEPSARLDLGGRESLVRLLDEFAATRPELPTVVVTHHVDEIPLTTTHCLLMRDGRTVTAGPIGDVLTSASLSECFGLALEVARRPNGRLTAYAS